MKEVPRRAWQLRVPTGWAWLLRGAALAALIGALLALAARSGPVSRMVSARVVAALAAATGREVALESALVGLVPPSVEIADLTVAGADEGFAKPFLQVDSASVLLSLGALLRGEILVDALEVDGVRVSWESGERPTGKHAAGGRDGGGRRIGLRRLNVRNGSVSYLGAEGDFSLDASGVEATATSVSCRSRLCIAGNARTDRFRMVFDEHRLSAGTLSLRFDFSDGRLKVDRFRLSDADLEVIGEAALTVKGGAEGSLTSSLAARGSPLASLTGGFPVAADALEADLTLEFRQGGAEVSGEARVAQVRLFDDVRARRATGTFSYAQKTFRSTIEAQEVVPALEAIPPARGGPVSAELTVHGDGRGEVDLRVGPIRYDDVLGLVDPRLPRSDLMASATGLISWTAGSPGSLAGLLDVSLEPAPGRAPPRSPPAGDRPTVALQGQGKVRISGDRISILEGSVSAPGLEALLHGDMTPGAGSADLRAAITRAELTEVLDALRLIPATTMARGRLEGTAAGSIRLMIGPDASSFSGRLSSEDLAVGSGEAMVGPVRARLDFTQAGDLLDLNGIEMAGAGWVASGELGLDLTRDFVVRRGQALLTDLPGDPIWQLAGATGLEGGAISGSVRYDLDEERAAASPGRFHLVLKEASLAGIAISEAVLEGTERRGRFEIGQLTASSAFGTARLSGEYSPRTGEGRFDLEADGLSLSNLAQALDPSREGFRGLVAVTGSGRIDGGGLRFDGSGRGSDLQVQGITLGNVMAPELIYDSAEGEGIFMRVSAPLLGATGTVRLAEPPGGPVQVDLASTGLALKDVHSLLPEEFLPGLEGSADLTVRGSIPPDDPLASQLEIEISSLSIQAGGLDFRATDRAILTLAGGRLTVGDTRIVGEGTDLTLSGAYDLGGGLTGGGTLAGRFDARLLALMVPEIDARGEAQVLMEAQVGGETVEYSGSLSARNIRLDYPGSPSPLTDLRMEVRVAPDGTLSIGELEFSFAGGRVTGTGGGRLEGFSLQDGSVELAGTGMSAEPIPDLVILYDGDAVISGAGTSWKVEGRLDVVRAVYRKEFGLQPAGGLGSTRAVPAERVTSGGPHLALDLDIVAPSDVLVRNQSAQLDGSARLDVTGSFSDPELTGRITIFEGGAFRFRDVTYRSAGGGILFDDPDTLDPLLDFTAITDLEDYTITLHVQGRASNPRFELSSEPTLSQRDIVSLLMTGEVAGAGLGPQAGAGFVAEDTVGQYLTAPLSETLGSTVGKFLGLTSVQLKPQFVNGSADPTARLTLTKRVSPELVFIYSDNLGTSQDEIYQFEYELSRAWNLIGQRDRDGSVSGDLRFRTHWGGPPKSGGREGGGSGRAARQISRLEFQGSPVGNEKKLRKESGISPGRPYSRADALEGRESLRRYLGQAGFPLASVSMKTEERTRQTGETVMDITYTIEPGMKVGLDVDGVKKEHRYERVVKEAWERGIFLEDLAARGKSALLTHLGSQGYAAAAVDVETVERQSGVRVEYRVDPGPRVQVRSIRFEGADSVDENKLRRAMATREDGWATRGLLRTSVLEEDILALQAVYLAEGFLDVSVKPAEITFTEDRSRADVVIPVVEGDPWKVGGVDIEGATEYPAESLKAAALLTEGSTLRPSRVALAEERLRDLLDGNGFHTARVRSRIEGPAKEARVIFTVEEGPRRTVDRISIRGNDRTATRVVRREIRLEPGDPVSRNALLDIQKRLYELGLFRSVDLRIEPLEEDPSRARVVVDLIEGDPVLTGLGVGYDTEERWQGLAQIGHNNVFGTGRAVSLLLRGSAINKRAQASFTDRRLFGVPFDGTLTTTWEEQERESFDVRRFGVGVQFLKKLTKRVTGLGRYNLSDVDLLDVDVDLGSSLDVEDQQILDRAVRLGHVGASLAWDSRDDILVPTDGSFATSDLSLFSPPFGSVKSFTRLFLSASTFVSTRGGIVFGMAARVGHEQPLGSTRAVPLAARFFSGGDNTLRGFKVDRAGPLDYTSQEPVGGEFQVLFNGEMRFPIYRALKGVIFYDVGNTFFDPGRFRLNGTEIVTREVADPNTDCAFSDFAASGAAPGERTCPVAVQDGLRHTLGVGLRLNTPLGPIRLELGRKMDRRFGPRTFDLGDGFRPVLERKETLYEVFLSIGQAF